MTRGAEELELKLKYFIQCIKNMPEDQSNSENKSTDKNNSVAFQEGISDEEMDLNSSDGKPQPRELPIPCLPQKLMWPKRDIKLSLQLTRTAREEKEHSMDQISSSDIPSKEKINQISEPFISDESIPYGTPVLPASLSSQRQLRLFPLQKKIYHQLEITKTVELTEEGKKNSQIPMDSAYASQDSHSKYFKAKEDNIPRNKDTSPRKFTFPRKSSFIPTICETPSSAVSTYSKNPVHNFANKGQNYKSGKDEMIESTCEQPEKLQSFNLLVASTPKMSSLNIFESSAFGTQDLPDQDENVTEGNTNTGSPLKSIGNIFEKMGENDEFTLPFASKPPQHFDDEKDDFGFTFPFGQDQKGPQDFSFQEFETSESTMKFTFF